MLRSVAVLTAALVGVASAAAQPAPPRVGAGFETWAAVPGQDLVPGGVAVGLRGRAALPLNADVSVAASLGIGAHLWNGASNARWVANPQTEVIVLLPSPGRSTRYVLGGFGGFLPFGGASGAMTIHLGGGVTRALSETSVFVEANPSLLIGEDETSGVLALRAGVIF